MKNPEQWLLLSPYLDQALTLPEEERAGWLESLRAENRVLADQVEALLQEQKAANGEGFLLKDAVAPRPTDGLAGQLLGNYGLVEPIGEGGMGAVWLAERNDGRFERPAAVKFLRHASLGQTAEARFKREGAILASLTHPNIAAIWDAGVSASKQPYLVLEYVQGEAITRYCDQHKLEIQARVKLFLDVLAAVAHAHANLIVHRDIKPANVFVSHEGVVKLLDFGIAKLLESGEQAAPTLLTQDAASPMTPEYAAPEQLTGSPITTATDVYSLGVLLYELLAGQHPAGANRRSAAGLVKAIVETDPTTLSKAVSTAARNEQVEAAANRNVDPDRLRRQLRGDLETIAAKALKKNPQERYDSVGAMADDLRRYLNDEPIRAHRDTLAYRAGKFMRRNRIAVSLSSLAFGLVIASLSIGLFLANRERKAAEQRFLQVRELANKFMALDEQIRGLPGSTEIRKQMAADGQRYLSSLSSESRVDNDLAMEIATSYGLLAHAQGDPTSANLGQFAEAEVSLNNAERFIRLVLSRDPVNRRALLSAAAIEHDRMVLADVQGRTDAELAHADAAADFLNRALQLGRPQPAEAPVFAYYYKNVAEGYLNRKHFEEAVRYTRQVLEISQSYEKARSMQGTATALLANALWHSGDLDGALKTVQDSMPLVEKTAAGQHLSLRINLANTLNLEGMILDKQDAEPSLGRTAEALAAFQRAHDIAEELAQKDPNDFLSHHKLAEFALQIGNVLRHRNPRKALEVYDHALSRIHEPAANDSLKLDEAGLLADASYAERHVGNKDEARRRIDRALELLAETHQYPAARIEPMSPSDHALRALADHYSETGQTASALETYEQLLDRLMAGKPDVQADIADAVSISRTWTALAVLLRRAGRTEEAQNLEAQRTDLWNQWETRLPNAQFLLRQSLAQATDLTRTSN